MNRDNREMSAGDTGMCQHHNFPSSCPLCKEAREKSWEDLAERRKRLESETTAEAMGKVEHLEIKDEAERAKMAKKIFNFLARSFGRNEVNSVATNDLILKEQISNTYIIRDKGNIQGYLLSHDVEVPGKEGEPPKMMFLTWYINTHASHRGERLGQAMYAKALGDFEGKLKREGKEFWGVAEEAESDVEKWFNRFHGAKRLYMETGRGVEDVPYLAPPEDESREGVPEHFMVSLAGNRSEMSVEEVKRAFEAVHAQYTDPRFFSVSQLKAEAGDYDIDPNQVDEAYAQKYHANYKGIVEGVRGQMDPILDKAKDGKVFLMSEQERAQMKEKGTQVFEIAAE